LSYSVASNQLVVDSVLGYAMWCDAVDSFCISKDDFTVETFWDKLDNY